MPENPEKRTDKAHTKDLMNQASTPEMTRPTLSRRFSVAPMMDWTDRHCRFFLRQLSRHTLL
ncbi:tRNA-dihydrouridine synthase, partial [Pseudomonas aeruginosa]